MSAMKRYTETLTEDINVLKERLNFNSGKHARNRFLKAAMTEKMGTYVPKNPEKHGLPNQKMLNLYDKWGNGNFGVILTGNVMVDPTHLESAENVVIFKEGDSPERRFLFGEWAKNSKQDGALAIIQLSHGGRQTPIAVNPKPFAPSKVQLVVDPNFTAFGEPIELTIEQIKTEVINRFVYAAKFAYETGFDGVELHAAHGYLLSQFTSPTTNKRTDKYGGSLENRLRIILEIYDAIRQQVPKEFIVGIKTNSVEFQSEGTTVEDAKEMCKLYEKKGVDFIELSGGTYEKFGFEHVRESTRKREAFYLETAEKIRPVFKNTVVYLTGGFRTVHAMIQAVESGATHGIGLGRPTTAEPDLPKKILEGKVSSALANTIDGNNFYYTSLASGVQMEQMGRTSLEEANNNIMTSISDFSNPETTNRFLEVLKDYVELTKTEKMKGNPVIKTLIFD
ncbi:unnamed protein product [Caenorhabditis angaria]|uniref:NADH:flavin oxidoreductase/NADH oxidase N-terminal domain-containing protein n=1 Tax=Caenorhabditis angaria TaxID=860376 RepID=A0A9P1IVR8_9PELO|nr:unnamed protein product [Caenorhabditis angaria]